MDRHRLDARPASVLNPMPVALSVDLQFHYRNRVGRKLYTLEPLNEKDISFVSGTTTPGVVVSVTRFGISCELNNFRRIFDTDACRFNSVFSSLLSRIDHLQYNRMSLLIHAAVETNEGMPGSIVS